jgi:hypothetical protein
VARGLGDTLGTETVAEQAVQVLCAVAAGLATFVAGAMILRIEEVALVRQQVVARWRG